jgi:hypothetical protein
MPDEYESDEGKPPHSGSANGLPLIVVLVVIKCYLHDASLPMFAQADSDMQLRRAVEVTQ